MDINYAEIYLKRMKIICLKEEKVGLGCMISEVSMS